VYDNPCRKFVLSPAAAAAFVAAEPGSAVRLTQEVYGGPLEEADLQAVIDNSRIPRAREYLRSRMDQSVCLRVSWNGRIQPVAWALVHADGEIGTLNVVDTYKRHGLATEVMRRVVTVQRERPAPYTGGWHWIDVIDDNAEGMAFYENLAWWEKAWVASWMSFHEPQ
jgi:ribosomal protein S18 acetylase RimI-like enzyme